MVLFFYYSVPNHYSSTDILSFLNIQATFCSLLHTHNSPPNLHPPTTQQRPNAPLRLSSVFTTTYIPQATKNYNPTTHPRHSTSCTPQPTPNTPYPTLHIQHPTLFNPHYTFLTLFPPLLPTIHSSFPAPYLQVNFCTPTHR